MKYTLRMTSVFALLWLVVGCATAPIDPTSIPIAQRCGADATPIDRVQQYLDEQVIIEGVVSASFQGEDRLNGFFVQSPGTTMTVPRPALFVRDENFGTPVQAGDRVRIEGMRGEYGGGTAIHSVSELTVCSRNQNYTVVPLELPIDYVAQYDNLLHQRVRITHSMTVVGHYQLSRFGTLDLATEVLWVPTQITLPGISARDHSAHNFLRRIVLDDGSEVENPSSVPYPAPELSVNNTVRSGDTVNNIEGILVRVDDAYHIHPVRTPNIIASNPRPEGVNLPGRGDIRVAAFNVLNYFNGDGQGGGFPTPRGARTPEEFERQRARIIAAMVGMNADVFALMELENDGFGSNSAIVDLTQGLQAAANAAGLNARYAFVRPSASRIGGDAITQAIIYRADRLEEIGRTAFTENAPFDRGSRPPLAQSFRSRATGGEFTVVANHFKSKGSCPSEQSNPNSNRGDGQGCWSPLRTDTATALARWLREFPTGVEHRNMILLGDFNSYAMEDPMVELRQHGYINIANRMAPEGYTYVFRGERGSLDHILAHRTMLEAVTGIDFWNINADEPVALEYGTRFKTPEQQQNWYAPTPFRSSDHDPVIIEVDTRKL
ncbi:ExeM/NucH family extracellular endonuclease [Aliidiomarina celeris]|uniref:ExeM/NucH family extracellular endonuclease n=1 Tax=Aliidiomarina celeris TaxID=2249428 RepID=UPI001300B23D|nr:ExeM/NucH family extracellular endonuclease [Aliidiomarina celeris]